MNAQEQAKTLASDIQMIREYMRRFPNDSQYDKALQERIKLYRSL